MRVAATADLHFTPARFSALHEQLNKVRDEADVFVLAGDLTNFGRPDEMEPLLNVLVRLRLPTIAVLGNHDFESDRQADLMRMMAQEGIKVLDGSAYERDGVGFAGTKGFVGGFGRHMLGSFGEPAIKAMVAESVSESIRLENAMRQVRSERVLVILHYAPIMETVSGEPLEIFPFLGSSRLAETIDRFRISAIVHGHAHRGTYEGRTPGGAPVYNVAMGIEKPTGRPYALLEI